MPVPVSTANAALSIVSGLTRLAGRVDRIMAEEAALREDLALPSKPLEIPPPAAIMIRKLGQLLEDTAQADPDPLAGRRQELNALLRQQNPSEQELVRFMEKFLPDELGFRIDDPSGQFRAKLREKRGAWDLDDEEILRAVYFLQPGEDLRSTSLTWQIAMSVVDVLAEVAAQTQSLWLRDEKARPILIAVLERFADADLTQVASQRMFLRVALRHTVNGVIDASDDLDGKNVWVDGVLGALATTRQSRGDDFVVGLLQGRGYPLLVANLIREGAGSMASQEGEQFEDVAADVLQRAAELVGKRGELEGFFREHWADLLRAGFRSVQENGHTLLSEESRLLRVTLLSAVDVLAETENRHLLTAETLTAVVETAAGAVAEDQALLDELAHRTLLRKLLGSSLEVLADEGLRQSLGARGLERMLQSTLTELATRPELLVQSPGLLQDTVGNLLRRLSGTRGLRLEILAKAGVQSMLHAIRENPALVNEAYPQVVANIAAQLSDAMADMSLTCDEAADLLRTVAEAVATRPQLILGENTVLPAKVLADVLRELARERTGTNSREALRDIVSAVLEVAAADPRFLAGRPELPGKTVRTLLDRIKEALDESESGLDIRLDGLVNAVLQVALRELAANPGLLDRDNRFAKVLGKLAGELAVALRDDRLTADESNAVLLSASAVIARNPHILVRGDEGLAANLVAGALKRLQVDDRLFLRNAALAQLLAEILRIVAAYGRALTGEEAEDELVTRVEMVIAAGVEQARQEVGRSLEHGILPQVLAGLMRRWALDQLASLDPADPRFVSAFREIAGQTMESAA